MKARKILFLLFILGLGASVETAWRVRDHVELGPLGWRVLGGKFYGPSFTYEEEKTETLPAAGAVAISNEFGGVKVSRGDGSEVRVHLRKVVYLPTEAEAQALGARVKLVSENAGSTLRLSTTRGILQGDGSLREAGLETHFDVTVPPGTRVEVKNEHGQIDVSDVARADVEGSFEPITVERVEGDAVIRGRHGDIHVASVAGALTVSERHGDVEVKEALGPVALDVEHGDVKLDRVGATTLSLKFGTLEGDTFRGSAAVKGEHAAVKLVHVSGQAKVDTSFENVRLEDVAEDVEVKTEHGAIEASRVKGSIRAEATFDGVSLTEIGGYADVKVDHGGVHGERLAKGATIRATGDDVTLEGFHGAVRIEAHRGSVHLEPRGPLTEPLSVTTEHGTITLQVDPGSRFDLSAWARPGNVEVGLTGFVATEKTASKTSGRVGGGGSPVVLEAQHGDITLEARETEAAAKEN